MTRSTPLWREMECALIARGLPPTLDWTDYAALLRVVESEMLRQVGQGSAFLRTEALRADRGAYH